MCDQAQQFGDVGVGGAALGADDAGADLRGAKVDPVWTAARMCTPAVPVPVRQAHSPTGAEVVTVEAGDVAAAGAAESIRRLGMDDLVRVVYADGYGGPTAESGLFDRIIVTVGIAGIPPAWFDRLTDDGLILAPTRTAGCTRPWQYAPTGPSIPGCGRTS